MKAGQELKGTYYSNRILEFESIYLYNHKMKGNAYYKNGKLEFEGEYLLDKKFNGKGYDEKGNVIYELTKGTGNVKEYKDSNLVFEGQYIK